MTTFGLHDQLRSLLDDIGDAAGVPSGPPVAALSDERAPRRPRLGRVLAAVAAVLAVLVGGFAIWQHRSHSVAVSAVTVAPGVGDWLDFPEPPAAAQRISGYPTVMPGTSCRRLAAPGSARVCAALSGWIETAYDGNGLSIELRTTFTNVGLDAYISGLINSSGGIVDQTPVTVRGHQGLRIRGGTTVVVWMERPEVIGQIRDAGSANAPDLVALADTLIRRPWTWHLPVGSNGECPANRSSVYVPNLSASGSGLGYYSGCDLEAVMLGSSSDPNAHIAVYADTTSTETILWWYPNCDMEQGFVAVGATKPANCANSTATTAAAKG
jgi:hypothetical protein